MGASDTRSRRLLRSGSHVQAALLLRQVRPEYEPNETLSTSGVGYHVIGRVTTPWLGSQDQVTFAAAGGKGIGRYIPDLGSEGGQDAVYNPADSSLNALPVFSGYLGYEHWWNERVRSVATWGTVWVDNLDFQQIDVEGLGAVEVAERIIRKLDLQPVRKNPKP